MERCQFCLLDFGSELDLQAHLDRHGGRVLRYECVLCWKTFYQGNSLLGYMRSHSSYREYQCSQCSKSFTQKGSLTRHENKQHKRSTASDS